MLSFETIGAGQASMLCVLSPALATLGVQVLPLRRCGAPKRCFCIATWSHFPLRGHRRHEEPSSRSIPGPELVTMLSREYLRRELEREWALVESAEKKLEEEKKKVVAEWVSVEDAQREYNSRRDEFEKTVSRHFRFRDSDDVVSFNVGGQLFKSTVKVWTRDRFSILAQLCTTQPKLQADADDGIFFFDRDFWVFRFVFVFLRDNILPDAVEELRELYCEASFYRLGLLRHAIEARMIGEDAMAASVLSSRPILGRISDEKVTSPSPQQDGTNVATKEEETKAASPVVEDSPSLASKYSALPDPFGFTSKT